MIGWLKARKRLAAQVSVLTSTVHSLLAERDELSRQLSDLRALFLKHRRFQHTEPTTMLLDPPERVDERLLPPVPPMRRRTDRRG